MNNRFLEQYKRADNICRDIFESETGITNYIDLMRDAGGNANNIPEWSEVLKTLTRLRSIRNKLTHEVGTLDMGLCTEEDIKWLDAFCNSLLDTTDPLAKHYRTFNKQKKKSHPIPDQSAFKDKKPELNVMTTTHKKKQPVYKTTPIVKKKSRPKRAVRMLIAFAIIVLIFYLLVELYKYIGA